MIPENGATSKQHDKQIKRPDSFLPPDSVFSKVIFFFLSLHHRTRPPILTLLFFFSPDDGLLRLFS